MNFSIKGFTSTHFFHDKKIKTSWPDYASELHIPRDGSLLAKLVPTFVDRGCHVVSVTDPHSRILGFVDRSHYLSFQTAPQL
jgi:CBS-domain-containing membrane protein